MPLKPDATGAVVIHAKREGIIMSKPVMGMIFAAAVMYGFAGNMMTGKVPTIGTQDKPAAIPDAAPGADPAAPRKVKENVVAYRTDDAAIHAAKAKAKNTLPKFADMWNAGKPGTYTVKFPLTQNGATEHIWLQVDGISGKTISGRLANEPVNGNEYRMGQKMDVPMAKIEDWMVNQGDAIYGGYTARVALAQMPDNERAKYERLFRD